MSVDADWLRRLPKAELHVHLDGSLRPATLLELAREAGHPLPAADAASLADWMHVTDARNLVDYLDRFRTTLAVMQSATAIERIARELVEDMAEEGVRYAEIRFCPSLNTRAGLTPDEVLHAALRGLRAAERSHDIRTALIVCALRNESPVASRGMAQLAAAFRDHGVVGFDLAGPEDGHPPAEHLAAFRIAAEAGLGVTIHAGEAHGPASIAEAVHVCGARRIGHGTRLVEDPDLVDYVNDFRIPVEVCLTSNVQTRVAASYVDHPLLELYEKGLVLTLCTDNRLMSATTVTAEYAHAARLGLEREALAEIALMGFESAFLPHAGKVTLLERVGAEIDSL